MSRHIDSAGEEERIDLVARVPLAPETATFKIDIGVANQAANVTIP